MTLFLGPFGGGKIVLTKRGYLLDLWFFRDTSTGKGYTDACLLETTTVGLWPKHEQYETINGVEMPPFVKAAWQMWTSSHRTITIFPT